MSNFKICFGYEDNSGNGNMSNNLEILEKTSFQWITELENDINDILELAKKNLGSIFKAGVDEIEEEIDTYNHDLGKFEKKIITKKRTVLFYLESENMPVRKVLKIKLFIDKVELINNVGYSDEKNLKIEYKNKTTEIISLINLYQKFNFDNDFTDVLKNIEKIYFTHKIGLEGEITFKAINNRPEYFICLTDRKGYYDTKTIYRLNNGDNFLNLLHSFITA
jgi:hypothetical protein